VPWQQVVRSHQTEESIQRNTPHPLGFDSQLSALAIIKLRFLAQQFFERTDSLLQTFNHVLLVAIHPVSDADHQKANGFIPQSWQ
jgi:hypothetical protein